MSEATNSYAAGEFQTTASSALSAGQVLQLSDGRAAFVAQSNAVASGDPVTYITEGNIRVASASETTFSVGDEAWFDASANQAIGRDSEDLDLGEDFPLGTVNIAKVATETDVEISLNVLTPGWELPPVTFDCQDGEDVTTAKTLVPSWFIPKGGLLYDCFGIVTEVFAGSSEDQGIITVKDTAGSPATLGTITAADSAADALTDIVRCTNDAVSASDGAVTKTVAAGNGITGTITQTTSGGTPAGKLRVHTKVAKL